MEQNQSLLMEKMIIQGNSSEQERKMFQAYFGKEPEHYCIVIVQFEQNEFLENSKMISNVMADFLTVRQIPLIGKVRNGIGNVLLLLDMTGLNENGTDWICQIFEQLAEEMSRIYKVKLHIGVSNVWSGLSNISRCYDQAKYVMQSMYVWEKENRVQVFHIDSNSLCINTLSVEFLERLYTVLICGRYNEAANAINLIELDYAKMPHFYMRL